MTASHYNVKLHRQSQSDVLYWALALIFAVAAGYTHVRINDSGLSILFVTGFAMFLAYKRPQRVWRWMIVMGLSLPLATLVAQLTREKPPLGMVAGSFAGVAFAVVSAIGGQVLRRVVLILFPKREAPSDPIAGSKHS